MAALPGCTIARRFSHHFIRWISVFIHGEVQYFDPITRQIFPDGVTQNCSDRIQNLFQVDMDQEDSCYTLTPGKVHQDKHAVSGPKEVTPMTAESLTGSQAAGMYKRSELCCFWDNILINAASRNDLKKFSQNQKFFPLLRKDLMGSTTTLQEPGSMLINKYIQCTKNTVLWIPFDRLLTSLNTVRFTPWFLCF